MELTWTKEVEYVPLWNGNRDLPADKQVKVALTTLSTYEFMEGGKIASALYPNVDVENLSPKELSQLVFDRLYEGRNTTLPERDKIVSAHVKSMTNLMINGETPTVEMLAQDMRGIGLISEIFMELLRISNPSETATGN